MKRRFPRGLTRARCGALVHSVASARPGRANHPLLARREEKRTLLIVISGERGLCGAFNANVMRRALEFCASGTRAKELEVMALGRKGRDALRKQRWKIVAEYVDITSKAERSRAAEIAHEAHRALRIRTKWTRSTSSSTSSSLC